MSMFREYGITLEEVTTLLDEFDIFYNYCSPVLPDINNKLYAIVDEVLYEDRQTEYSIDYIYEVVELLHKMWEDGYTLDNFVK